MIKAIFSMLKWCFEAMTDFVKFYDIALNVIENWFFSYCKPSYLNKNIKFSFGLQKQHKIFYRVILY